MPPPSPLADAFEAVRTDRADEILLIAPSEGRTWTGQDIHEAAVGLGDALHRCGLGSGHLVIVSVGNRAVMPPLALASLREGLPLMPVDRSTPAAELWALAESWRAAALIVPARADLDTGTGGPASAGARVDLPHGVAAYLPATLPEPGAHAPAAVLKLTSGSTGAPRATCTEERHLVADVRHITHAMGIGPTDRQLGVIPLSHSYGFSNLLLPLLWQGTPLLLRPQFVPTQVVPDIRDGALSTFAGVPFMFDHLVRHQPAADLGALGLVVSAGARLPFETVEGFHRAFGRKVRSFYGSSETGGICFDGSETLDERVPVGTPMGATVVTLVDDEHAPPGSGRVQVHGPNVTDRYMEPPGTKPDTGGDGAAAAFVGPGTFLTGDHAVRDAGGVYVLTGRVASFVNVAGRKVHPREVEDALRGLPGVADAVAMAVDDPLRGQTLGACLASSRPWDARAVRAALSSRLAAWKLPRVVVVVPTLPLTGRGKIDRVAIARLLREA